ncbi:MAG: hypothetical protein HC866_16740 [Leptolyngbyaceae cyanobacterium RU_5_1]|nr:hypothetical protein [Leptolyngbyaceae cyanobacterium RU_5_1]
MTNTPYLSVVATARNDNHGGNMLRRMQIFVNGLIEQSRRHQLDTELIIVEWNPLVDQPTLAEALSWQTQDSPCTVRIIQVPPELHQQLKYSQSLPLFQMIAKNVGIRRAQGEFVLATNIDLLFSDALFEFISARQLQPGKSYRIDRTDVRSTVPLETSLEEQLAYCDRNILRINHKDGIEELDTEAPEPLKPVSEAVGLETASVLDQPKPRWYEQIPESTLPQLTRLRQFYKRLLPKAFKDVILRTLPKGLTEWLIEKGLLNAQPVPVSPQLEILEKFEQLEESEPESPPWQYPRLHTNACGDFTLMSRADWFTIRGYPEWEIFSFHLDSILLYIAHYAGIEEKILDNPMRVYHVEHTSGWTPQVERTQTLNKRLNSLGIPQLTIEQFDALARLMQQLDKPLIFNDENWGMATKTLPETVVPS